MDNTGGKSVLRLQGVTPFATLFSTKQFAHPTHSSPFNPQQSQVISSNLHKTTKHPIENVFNMRQTVHKNKTCKHYGFVTCLGDYS